ncbi:MAG: DUF2309 domain-containing protein [Planctomycetota bacterium]
MTTLSREAETMLQDAVGPDHAEAEGQAHASSGVEASGVPSSVADAVRSACFRVPPLWSLSDYVAVNPFLGFASGGWSEAAAAMGEGFNASPLPDLDYYRGRLGGGDFDASDVRRAAARLGHEPEVLESALEGQVVTRQAAVYRTFAQRHDAAHGTHWDKLLVQSHSRWCSAFASGGTPAWAMPAEERLGLFHGWLEAESIDRTLEINGLRGWRKWIAALPDDADAAIEFMLDRLAIPVERRVDYLYRLLGGVYGWASFFRREPWFASLSSGEDTPGNVGELLAIRVCSDAAVAELTGRDDKHATAVRTVEDETVRAALQDAYEDGYARRLLGSLNRGDTVQPAEATRPSAQALFCIDVRSEILRRHLEAADDKIETRGFAGFFGVAIAVAQDDGQDSARCPVLLSPGTGVALEGEPKSKVGKLAKPLQFGPASTFSYVELLGLGYVGKLAADAGKQNHPAGDAEHSDAIGLRDAETGEALGLEARVQAAATILKFTGLGPCGSSMARLVLLCGHGGCSANNPHAAGLDCGACGGHGGGLNARVAAGILNDPEVRAGLNDMGVHVPGDTLFLAGLHNTTTDEVTVLDRDAIPSGHHEDLRQLEASLAQAGEETRLERSASLGLTKQPKSRLASLLSRRSRDWSETRPEWALARNAAFIAARRGRTKGVDLAGRSFLHEYDAAHDPDDAILTLILSAPMVVASWINLQYFASTVDNDALGAGDKPLHNRVGNLGVVLGNGGDLRTGLAKQSVHAADGSWYHQPLRLQVLVEAARERIDGVLTTQPHVTDLVTNGWVRLFALDRDSDAAWLRTGAGWEDFAPSS